MQNIDATVDLNALRSINVDDVIDSLERDSCREYQQIFQDEAKKAKDAGSDESHAAWCCLAAITSMYLKPGDPKAPFGPMFVMDDCRGAIPEDLSEDVLRALSDFYPEIKSAELRARIADILWLRQRRPKFAQDAVNAYIESARKLEDPENWTHCAKRAERALRLAAMFRRKDPSLYSLVTDYIEEVIARYRGEDILFLSVKFLELLADFKHEDDGSYYQLAVDIAQAARTSSSWHKAEQAWAVAAEWANILNDTDKRHEVLTNMAETFCRTGASIRSWIGFFKMDATSH